MIGEVIDYRYEVLEKIGDGALFTVYKCKDKVLNRLVALKILNNEYASRRDFADKIAENARRSAKLTHPGIARIIESESGATSTTIACEYVRGVSIRERLRRETALSISVSIEIMLKVLEALEHAHAVGFVHGDLRPQDIIVSPDGEVKITDFGVAEALRAFPTVAERLSMRSILYQAPETTEGAVFTAASDVYSVGAIFYEMLTGKPAFEGATTVAVAVRKVKEQPVAVRQLNPEVPKSLNDLIMRCLQVDPKQRYSSIASMRSDLLSIQESLYQASTGKVVRSNQPAYTDLQPAQGSRLKEVGLLSLVFVGVVLLVFFIVYMMLGTSKKVSAPQLVGLSWDEAYKVAGRAGILLIEDGKGHSDRYPAGVIFEQTPSPGEYINSKNKEVRVKISEGMSWVTVPDLRNQPEPTAREIAIRSSFNIGDVKEQYSDTIPPNNVISQDPDPGVQRSPNSNINIVLSKGIRPPAVAPAPPPVPAPTPDVSTGKEQTFNVEVEVPGDGGTQKNVRIVVNDDSGENIVVDDMQTAGTHSYDITTYGSHPTIKVYVDGDLKNSVRY